MNFHGAAHRKTAKNCWNSLFFPAKQRIVGDRFASDCLHSQPLSYWTHCLFFVLAVRNSSANTVPLRRPHSIPRLTETTVSANLAPKARRKPRTLCCCQFVACIMSSMLAPSGRLRRVNRRSCLVTRPSCCASATFGGWPGAGVDLGFGEAIAFWPRAPRVETARLDLVEVSIVGVDMMWGSVGTRRRDWRSHHPKPRNLRGEPGDGALNRRPWAPMRPFRQKSSRFLTRTVAPMDRLASAHHLRGGAARYAWQLRSLSRPALLAVHLYGRY